MASAGWVEDALRARLDEGVPRGTTPESTDLAAAVRSASEGGKRFRPFLVSALHGCLGGSRPDAVAAVGAAVELLHTAFVVHDDVIDGDSVRRGRPSIPAWFEASAARAGTDAARARSYGVAGAILTGDLALTAAVRAVATAPAPRSVTTRMLDLVEHALAATAAGELADVRFATHDEMPSLARVLAAEERKTAVYSFALPMQLGAVLADAPEDHVEALAGVGRHLGLAFQLRDDLDGVFGDERVTGKSTTSDLREGKCTAMIVHASTTEAWSEIAVGWGDPGLSEAGSADIRAALERCGSRDFVEQLVVEYVDAASASAAAIGLPGDLVRGLTGLCVPATSGAA